MARYQDISPTLLARLFEERVKAEVREQLNKTVQEIVKEILDKAVKDVTNTLAASAEIYRSADRFGEDLRITLIDKRKNNG